MAGQLETPAEDFVLNGEWGGGESHLELVDFIAQSLLLQFEPFLPIMYVTFRFVVRLLEHF